MRVAGPAAAERGRGHGEAGFAGGGGMSAGGVGAAGAAGAADGLRVWDRGLRVGDAGNRGVERKIGNADVVTVAAAEHVAGVGWVWAAGGWT